MLKLFLILVVLTLIPTSLIGSEIDNKKIIDVVFSYSSYHTEDPIHNRLNSRYNNTKFSIVPRFGYNISPSFTVGLGIGYISELADNEYSDFVGGGGFEVTWYSYLLDIFIASEKKINNSLSLCLELENIYGLGKLKSDVDTWGEKEEYDRKIVKFALRPGIKYSVTKDIKADISVILVEYHKITDKPKTREWSNGVDEYFGPVHLLESIRLGISYCF